jgi:hypothetical protein
MASVIAFIIPRTFRRVSAQNKLDVNFVLLRDYEIPESPCAFEPPMAAKCCFQIWTRALSPRSRVEQPTRHPDWRFVSFERADFAIRAYGGKCGEIATENLQSLNARSWHFISSNIDSDELIRRFRSLNYSIAANTSRQDSIGRGDLVALYSSR